MKYIRVITAVILICFVFSACGTMEHQKTDHFDFDPAEFTIIEEKDTHGGFHGDGFYYLILDCSENPDRAYEITKEWNPLPLSDNLDLIMYGGERDGVSYGYNFAEKAHWPVIRNGVYKFVDRHAESVNESEDTNLLSRSSFNFSIAVYDFDTDTLYYFEIDT